MSPKPAHPGSDLASDRDRNRRAEIQRLAEEPRYSGGCESRSPRVVQREVCIDPVDCPEDLSVLSEDEGAELKRERCRWHVVGIAEMLGTVVEVIDPSLFSRRQHRRSGVYINDAQQRPVGRVERIDEGSGRQVRLGRPPGRVASDLIENMLRAEQANPSVPRSVDQNRELIVTDRVEHVVAKDVGVDDHGWHRRQESRGRRLLLLKALGTQYRLHATAQVGLALDWQSGL